MTLSVIRATGGRWRANAYLVVEPGGDALLVDPGHGTAELLGHVRDRGWRVRAILATHGHFDHVEGAALARAELAAPFLVHPADAKLVRSLNLYRTLFAADAPVPTPEVDGPLGGGDTPREPLRIGPFAIRVHHLPGHTAGSVALGIDDLLFTGDTLLPGSVGRTDLPGGDPAALAASLTTLVALAGAARILPGHRDETTLAAQLATNERLAAALGRPHPGAAAP